MLAAYLIEHEADPSLDEPFQGSLAGVPGAQQDSRESAGSEQFVFVRDELKMVLLVRSDLGMSPGKVAAQCAHATLGAYRTASEGDVLTLQQWELSGEAVIVLKVESEEQLLELELNARGSNLVTHLTQDAGRTEVSSGTTTVAAIGPAPVSKIDAITGKLSLF
mmetsp:Transcript_25682/g.40252  ORF Transcript_25682/g.40252 Transcript_25682/m.40252 type:complete len:164 (-) Transcript_25682:36-527(-)